MPRLHIGTSGWHYAHWRGAFYPPGVGPGKYLEYYAGVFDTAEINNSFYRLPAVSTLEGWRDTVPEDFVFAVKGSRYITHNKKLSDPAPHVRLLFGRIEALASNLGPVLFQLPPMWKFNGERLAAFLAALPKRRRYAFEFRNPTWFNAECYSILEGAGAAFCIYDLGGRPSPLEVTADFVYVRLHGPAGRYGGSYGDELLVPWTRHLQDWRAEGRDVYLYFDNDHRALAVANALRLKELAFGKPK